MNKLTICVDFDGTVVKNRFPYVGPDCGAEYVLRMLIAKGHKIILNTMRGHNQTVDSNGDLIKVCPSEYDNHITVLDEAINWFHSKRIPLSGINCNPDQLLWTDSPKVYGDLYIDDLALGCPLKNDGDNNPSYVDWDKVQEFLILRGIL